MDFDSYKYYSLESSTLTYDRATGKFNRGEAVTVAKFDYYTEVCTKLVQEAANFLNTHPGSVIGIVKEDSIVVSYDQNEPVQKYQFFTAIKHKS